MKKKIIAALLTATVVLILVLAYISGEPLEQSEGLSYISTSASENLSVSTCETEKSTHSEYNQIQNNQTQVNQAQSNQSTYNSTESYVQEVDENITETKEVITQQETEAPKEIITISIDCKTLLDKLDTLPKGIRGIIPLDGYLLNSTGIAIDGKTTVFDVLKRVCKDNGIQLEHTSSLGTVYVEGIGNIYEFDVGSLSGWMYSVNGEFPQVGMSGFVLKPGDVVRVSYTCNMGEDIKE